MKKLVIIALAILVSAGTLSARKPANDREYLGLPGDNLNLFAVMKLFQESETLEAFERGLNDPDKIINNLDLNGDNYVDYILVMHYPDGNVHNIVLRVALNKREYQDVAVITVENFRNGAVQLQIVGDEALYGPNYIVEPNYSETPNPGYTGIKYRRNNGGKDKVVTTTYYEVANWPVIVYINRPGYVVWRSSWSWGYYPDYWRPWTPYYWHYYYGYHYNWFGHYYAYYSPYDHIRCRNYKVNYYTHIRHTSPTIVVNVNKGVYKNTYSRPELRIEGERLYSHRASMSGSTMPPERASRSEETAPRPGDIGSERAVKMQDERRDRGVANERPVREAERAPRTSEARSEREGAVSRPGRVPVESRPGSSQEPSVRSGRETRSAAPAPRSNTEVRRIEPSRQERSQTSGIISRSAREDRSGTEVRRSESVREERNRPAERNSGTISRPSRSTQQNASRGQEISRPDQSKENKSEESSNRSSERSERSNRSSDSRR